MTAFVKSLERSRKSDLYAADAPGWLAKLDTIVHELYHIDPDESGIRRVARSDGTDSPRSHGPNFYEDVAEMVHGYLSSGADPSLCDFLEHDFSALTALQGGSRRPRSRIFRRSLSDTWRRSTWRRLNRW